MPVSGELNPGNETDLFRFNAAAGDKFNFDVDIAKAEQSDNNTINALDPNLKKFFERGGKLI